MLVLGPVAVRLRDLANWCVSHARKLVLCAFWRGRCEECCAGESGIATSKTRAADRRFGFGRLVGRPIFGRLFGRRPLFGTGSQIREAQVVKRHARSGPQQHSQDRDVERSTRQRLILEIGDHQRLT